MQSSEVYYLLVRRIRRGLVIFTILWFASVIVTCILALIVPGGRPWAVTAFLASIYIYLGRDHVGKRHISALRVSEYPQVVYWAHPTSGHQAFSNDAMHDCTLIMLHLRDGTEFEVRLPPEQMRAFIAWLVERNPSVRLGAYDETA